MISLDYSLGIQIINFLLLILILNVLLYKPILAIIDKRRKQIEESENEIKRLEQDVEQKMAAYDQKLNEAKAAAVEQKNETVMQGSEEAKGIIDAVRNEIPGILEQFHNRTDNEIAAAKNVLTENTKALSVEIAEKILGRSLR